MNPRVPAGIRLIHTLAAVFLLAVVVSPVLSAPAAASAKVDPDNGLWSVTLVGFFPGEAKKSSEPKRLNCYLVRRDAKWVAALATPTNSGQPVWNSAFMLVDPSNATVKGNKLSGTLAVTLVPDPWVPKDQKVRSATVTLDATLTPGGNGAAGAPDQATATVAGTWKADITGNDEELKAALLQPHGEGEIIGAFRPSPPNQLADDSYDLGLYNLVPGTTSDNFQRRRALSIGVKQGKVVSARLGQMDMRSSAYDYVPLDTPTDFTVTPDGLKGNVAFTLDSLDGDLLKFTIELAGERVHDFVAGTWKGAYTDDAGKQHPVSGFFKGNVKPGAFVTTAKRDDRPWYVDVAGFHAPQSGEHPRLFFRKSDVPELRRRAETPEGKQIIARLRQQLNGSDGQSMPTIYNPAKLAYDKNNFKDRLGAFTISHAAGFGFLYQLTGETKYADLARQCVEKEWEGQRSSDDRYAWVAPGGELRAGPSVGWCAAAYDLCYDAWPNDFRVKVAQAIQNYSDTRGGEWNKAEGITLRKMVLTPRQGPGSNHFGAVVGGCGLAVLAIENDPGTDRALLSKYEGMLERQVVRHLSAGWGDGGYYKEGWGASRVGTQGGFLCFLQALRVARGHDYLNVDRPNASYVTMVPRCLLVLRGSDHAYFPYRSNMGGTYGNPEIGSLDQNGGLSWGGHFSEGFGAIADRYKPGLLWAYNHLFSPDNKFLYDTLGSYPHRSMLALVNWPTFAGVHEANPAEAMPLVVRDTLYDHFAFRNGFKGDSSDIVTTVVINYPDGTRPRDVMAWGLGGLRLEFGEPIHAAHVTHFAPGKDGSGTVTAGDWAIAVDYSRASGADALIVTTGGSPPKLQSASDKVKVATLDVGGTTFNVLSLSSSGKHPDLNVDGNSLILGGQTIRFADGKFTLAKFEPQK